MLLFKIWFTSRSIGTILIFALGENHDCSYLSCMNTNVIIFTRIMEQIKFVYESPIVLEEMSKHMKTKSKSMVLISIKAEIRKLRNKQKIPSIMNETKSSSLKILGK